MSGQIPEYTGRNRGVLRAGADRRAISVGARMHQRDHGLKDVHHRNPAPRPVREAAAHACRALFRQSISLSSLLAWFRVSDLQSCLHEFGVICHIGVFCCCVFRFGFWLIFVFM